MVKQGITATSGARTSIDLASRVPEEEIKTVTDEMICSEVDGLLFHRLISTPQGCAEEQPPRTGGRIPLRFVYTDVVKDPASVAAEIRRALDRANRGVW